MILPLSKAGLGYYDALDKGGSDRKWYLSPKYKESGLEPESLGKFAKAVGAQVQLEAKKQPILRQHPEYEHLIKSAPGEVRTWTSINEDYIISEFNILLDSPSVKKAQLIWRTMQNLPDKYLKARFRRNKSNDFRYGASTLVHNLIEAEWCPQNDDGSISLVYPRNASVERLPEGFPYEAGQKWLEAIKFGEAARKQSEDYRDWNTQAERMGFTSADEARTMAEFAAHLREKGISPKDHLAQYVETKPEFPTRPIKKPQRRKE